MRAVFFAILAFVGISTTVSYAPTSSGRATSRTFLSMSTKKPSKTGAGFNYDPSNYKDSNSANYRRLTDQLAAVKAEDEKLQKEREELIRKEQMAAMFLKKENSTFWDTPGDKLVASSDSFYVSPEVLQIIDDLDNQLIGLKPVSIQYVFQFVFHMLSNVYNYAFYCRDYLFLTPLTLHSHLL